MELCTEARVNSLGVESRADVLRTLKTLKVSGDTERIRFIGSEAAALDELRWLVSRLPMYRPLAALEAKLVGLLAAKARAEKLSTLEARTVVCLCRCPVAMDALSAGIARSIWEKFYSAYCLEEPPDASPVVVAAVRLDRVFTESVYRGLRTKVHGLTLAARVLRLLAAATIGASPCLTDGHVNFRFYRGQHVDIVGVADCGHYHRKGELGLDYIHAIRHCIDTAPLLPIGIDPETAYQCREDFFVALRDVAFDEQRRHITFGVGIFWIIGWCLHMAGVPREKSRISLDGAPRLICCQFVLYAMAEALRRVYAERKWGEPDFWQVFGLDDTLDLDYLFPNSFFERLKEKGILKPIQPDPNAVIA